MKHTILFLSFMVFLADCSQKINPQFSQNRALLIKEKLQEKISTRLEEKTYHGVKVSINIMTSDKKNILFQKDVDSPYITASVFKIVSSGIALEKFGPDKRFQTLLCSDSKLKGETWEGNLYLVGKGDSSLMKEDLEKMAESVKESGIRNIDGDLIYDSSYFDEEKNRFGNHARNLYAPPSALIVNYGWIDVNVKKGPPLSLEINPKTSYARLSYDLEWSSKDEWGRPSLTYKMRDWGDEFSVRGVYAAKDRQYHYLWLGASRPALYTATLFKEALEKKDVKLKGKIRTGKMPKNATVFLTYEGKLLKDIVTVMNQESNNVIAEMINKSLGAEFVSVPGTRQKGLNVIRQFFINDLGFIPGSFSIGDSSGLSISNRLSTSQVCSILTHFYRNRGVRDTFIATLARQGHHPHAMNPVPPDEIRVYVKTGTLSVQGVNTVAGYIFIASEKAPIVFSIMANRVKPGPMTYSGTLTNPLLSDVIEAIKSSLSQEVK